MADFGDTSGSVQVWDHEPGARIRRTELHKRFGGRGQGGIGPSPAAR